MARNTYTPVNVWAEMPLASFGMWIRANNELNEDRKKK